MRIGIDATPVGNRSGTGYYTGKLIEYLGRADSENEYFLYCAPGYRQHLEHSSMFEYPNFRVVQVPVRGRALGFGWKQVWLPRQIKKEGIDLFHFPAFIGSLRTGPPSIVTVHDLCFVLFPEAFSRIRRWYYKRIIPRSIRNSHSIIVDSDSTKNDLFRYLGVKSDRVHRVYLGVDPVRFYKVTRGRELDRLRNAYSLPSDFILYVGTLEPRKNITRLLRAFAYGVLSKGLPYKLVIAGRKGWLYEGIFREVRAMNLGEHVYFPGYVKPVDLAGLYSMARAFAYPSLYEGFGLPCLEAMSCGTPVLASSTSALPEVVGDCAVIVNPISTESIAEGLRRICSDEELNRRLSSLGPRRASRFSWLTTAKKTVEVYNKTYRETR